MIDRVYAVIAGMEQTGDYVMSAVADNGSGMTPAVAEKAFDPFFTTKEPGKGTGMGLAISQSIVREHDGTIEVEQGRSGARFVVTLPMLSERSDQSHELQGKAK